MASQETYLRTRFRAADDDAARQIGDLLRDTAAAAACDARRHAGLVLDNGGVDRVLPLLRERLDTVTLLPLASSARSGNEGGRSA